MTASRARDQQPGVAVSAPTPTVRAAEPASAAQLGRLIATALSEDPTVRRLIPNPDARAAVLPDYYATIVGQAFAAGAVDTVADYTATAVWLPNTAASTPEALLDRLGIGPYRRHLAALDEAERVLWRRRPATVDYHRLVVLAVHPSMRGRGIATALLQQHLHTTDAAGLATCVDAHTPDQRLRYQRHGYRDLPGGPVLLTAHGPLVALMIRHPGDGPPPQEPARWRAGPPSLSPPTTHRRAGLRPGPRR